MNGVWIDAVFNSLKTDRCIHPSSLFLTELTKSFMLWHWKGRNIPYIGLADRQLLQLFPTYCKYSINDRKTTLKLRTYPIWELSPPYCKQQSKLLASQHLQSWLNFCPGHQYTDQHETAWPVIGDSTAYYRKAELITLLLTTLAYKKHGHLPVMLSVPRG